MALMDQWKALADEKGNNRLTSKDFWADYFAQEKGFYEKLLKEELPISGTVKELADKYELDPVVFTGILDGIDEALDEPNPIDTLEEDTVVNLNYDREKLYKAMVEYKADWLYTLPEWDALLTPERRKELDHEQRASHTVVREKKVFPNDPCPCGSGKKYKHCCGKKK